MFTKYDMTIKAITCKKIIQNQLTKISNYKKNYK